jgi:TonB family protein
MAEASLRDPSGEGLARARGPGSPSGSESRSPEFLNTPALRQVPARPAARRPDDDPEASGPQLSALQLSVPQLSAPPRSAMQPKEQPGKNRRPHPLPMAGFPEACVERPLMKPSSLGRAPEAGFLQAAPGSDSAAYRGLPAGRSAAPCEGNLPAAATALPAPVQILSKPFPRYPEEALRRRLQGDVLLDVEFRYSGSLEVLGVRRGLGHGLNESAIEAARKLRFVPARRDGRPVDTQATLRIRFQLLQ